MDKLPYFVRVFVIGLGFASGFWIAVGIDPEAVITGAFAEAANSISSGSGIIILLIPVISTAVSIYFAYAMGGWLGLLAVGIAFIGGIIFLNSTILSLVLIAVAIVIGILASNEN